MHRHRQHVTWLALVLALGGLTTAARSAIEARTLAAPEIIIVHGGALPEQRVLASIEENHRLLLSVNRPAPFPSAPLSERPALQLALFWGWEWHATAESPERLRALRPGQANQRGTFYPATGTAPALLMVGHTAGVVSDSGLAILARHAVPVRLP